MESPPASGRGRRASNACERCRRRKIRCTGSHPCTNCSRKNLSCHFDGQGRKVVVSQKYLQELQRAAARSSHSDDRARVTSKAPAAAISFTSGHDDDAALNQLPGFTPVSQPTPESATEPSNPLASAKSSYVSDDKGRLRWLGESSTWSFSRKTLMVIRDHLKASDLPDVCINEESRAYDLDWGNQPFDSAAKFHNLPSIDHATYLIESLKFHVGQIFHLFDEANFIHQVREFYVNPAKYAGENRIWYVQFLAVLALAKAVGTNPAKGSRTLPGSEFFTRAMSLMPDSSYLFNDALTAIEALCIIALYLQSADMRNSAYIYTGQATRMSLVFGLHRERPTDGVWSPETASRCHKVWWTVYILERTFTSTIGVPMSIHEEDITTPMPKRDGTQNDMSLYIHVRISGLIFQVIRKVYGAEGRLQASFLPSVREVLTKIASIAGDLNGCFPLPSDGSGAGISRAAAHLHLVYHQAVLLTMYPLLLYLVQARLREESREPKASRTFSETTQALLKTCAESCNTMIHILSALRQEGLLECSLPFDLERIFSAAFVLKMLHFLTPRLKSYRPLRSESNLLLDDLIDRGSIPARFRKSELASLEVMMQIWTDEGPEIVDDGPSQESERPQDTVLHSELPQLEGVETGLGEFEANFVDPNRMSPGHLLSLVEMVDVQEGATDSDMAWMDAWLWENPEELPLV